MGDEEEDDVDDLENEFNYMDKRQSAGVKASQHLVDDRNHLPQQPMPSIPQVPLLTNTRHVCYHNTSILQICCYAISQFYILLFVLLTINCMQVSGELDGVPPEYVGKRRPYADSNIPSIILYNPSSFSV